jgi:uncharacterized membrane protein YkoI
MRTKVALVDATRAVAAALLMAGVSLAGVSLIAPSRADAGEVTGKSRGGDPRSAHRRSDATAGGRCLSRQEQRARIAARTVVPLGKAARAVKGRRDTLLNARLCERNGRLVYLLTVLARGGKVLRATVDAGSGALIRGPR